MIVTFSGPSGVGKTTVYRKLLERLPNSSMLVSYTTREKRESDIPGEYKYNKFWCNKFWFWLLTRFNAFLWTVDIHGNKYSTTKRSVRKALANHDEAYFMNITPDKVVELRNYARERGSEDFILSIYIVAPPASILRKRLEGRGESEFEIRKRLKDCEKWDMEAEKSAIPYIMISNDGDVEDAVNEVLIHIKTGGSTDF